MAVAHNNGVPLIVDNTIATPVDQPLARGADIVVRSAQTPRRLAPQSRVIVDDGTFDGQLPESFRLHTRTRSFWRQSFIKTSAPPACAEARVQLLRDLGPAVAPFNAFLIAQGLNGNAGACASNGTSPTPDGSRSSAAATRW